MTSLSQAKDLLCTYTEKIGSNADADCTLLLAISAKTEFFSSFFCTNGSVSSERKFASKLHWYLLLSVPYMIILCRQDDVLTPTLEVELRKMFHNCTSCNFTGRSCSSQKLSFFETHHGLQPTCTTWLILRLWYKSPVHTTRRPCSNCIPRNLCCL